MYIRHWQRKKRGKPSSSPAPQPLPIFKKKRVDKTRSIEKQHDLYDHFPEHDGKPNSLFCKRPGCHLMSNWMCENCGVHLCITKLNNCFKKITLTIKYAMY